MAQRVVAQWLEFENVWGEPRRPVTINYERLEKAMEVHTPKLLSTKAHLPPIPGVGSKNPLVAASYILTGNIWNFHFKTPGEPPYRVANPESQEKPFEGFMAFWHKLYQHFGENIITAAMLRPHVRSVDAMREFFRDITEIPLLELRQHCGLNYVRGLENRYDGNSIVIFRDVASDGTFRAFYGGHGLIEVLVREFDTAYGQDYRFFARTSYLAFHKRARLVAMMLHQCAINFGGKMRLVADIDEVAPPIDYQIPRILHSPQFGVLHYAPDLDQKIEQGEEIPRGSLEEILIRMAAMTACCYWMEKKHIPGWLLDAYLFSNSRGLPNKAHYTKTSDY